MILSCGTGTSTRSRKTGEYDESGSLEGVRVLSTPANVDPPTGEWYLEVEKRQWVEVGGTVFSVVLSFSKLVLRN